MILANLVGNALRDGEPPVVVTARSTPNGLEVKVRDHGKGIPAADLPHVFNRFYKAGARGDGSGLGLSIARANAHLHGGTISVRSPGVQHPFHGLAAPGMKRLTCLLAAVLTLAGCGISPSEVQDRAARR